jgi:uridine kinase
VRRSPPSSSTIRATRLNHRSDNHGNNVLPRPFLIGIAGGTGSGKTTVARAIIEAVAGHAVLIDMDAYYRPLDAMPLAERDRVNFDHPDTIDFPLLISHVRELRAGRAIEKPVYDFSRHTRAPHTEHVEPREVVVVEGILCLASPGLRALFDLKVFVDVPDEVRFARRLARDVSERGRTAESVRAQYEATVRPMHREFVEPGKAFADIVLHDGEAGKAAWEALLARARREALHS